MDAATENVVVHNDARDNNLSGLAPCYRCNLSDLSIGGNVWQRNLGTFNLTDACAQRGRPSTSGSWGETSR
jgi:hypothetical protein